MKRIINQLNPVECIGFTRVRVGNENDGGYVVLDEVCKTVSNLSTFGVGDDVSFELDFVKRYPDTEVQLFDPTIECLPVEHPDFEFFKEGIETGLPYIPKLLQTLKIDVEGAEWDVLLNYPQKTLDYADQLLIEFHFFHVGIPHVDFTPYFEAVYEKYIQDINYTLFAKYERVLKRLNKDFHLFHMHVNNSLGVISEGNVNLPPLLELSFVRKSRVGEIRPAGLFPVEGLDNPNKPWKDDIIFNVRGENGRKV